MLRNIFFMLPLVAALAPGLAGMAAHGQSAGVTSATQQTPEISAKPVDPAAWTGTDEKLPALIGERYYGVYAGSIKVGYSRIKLERKQIGAINCYKAEEAFHLIDPKVGDRGRVDSYYFRAEKPWDLMERGNVETIGPKTVASTKEWREGDEWVVERTVGDHKIPARKTAGPPMLLAHKFAVELWAMRQPQVGDVMITQAFDDASQLGDVESSIKRVADDGKGGKLFIVATTTTKGIKQDMTVSEKGEVLEIRTDLFVMRAEPAQQAQDLMATRELLLRMPAAQ